jgi:hypothetical protein
MTILVSIISSVLTGIVSSVLFWWWRAQLMRPKLLLCPMVAHYRLGGEAESRYQIKIINKRRRPVVDLNINVALIIPDLVRQGSTEIISLHKFERPFLDVLVKYRIQPEDMPSQTQISYLRYFPPHIAEAIRGHKTVDLKELLALHSNSAFESACLQKTHSQAQDVSFGPDTELRKSQREDSWTASASGIRVSCRSLKTVETDRHHWNLYPHRRVVIRRYRRCASYCRRY